jgi:hypothetical protein
MTRYFLLLALALALSGFSPAVLAQGKKDKEAKDPDWLEFSLLKDGQPAGIFGFKTTAGASGQIYTSSQLEMKGKRGGLAIQTHVEKDPSGKLIKYKKWIGSQGAAPDVIAFWNGKKLRIVSKAKDAPFTKDLSPAEGFFLLDRYGFHLYADLVGLWKARQQAKTPFVALHTGKTGTLEMSAVGSVNLKDGAGKEVKGSAVKVKADKLELTLFVGEKPSYLGFQAGKLVMIRKGWNLVSVEAGVLAPAPIEGEAAEPPKDDKKPETEEKKPAPEEKKPEAEKKPAAEEKKSADLPPLPEL